MKKYILSYQFLDTQCELEYHSLYEFCRKLDAIQDMPEINQDSIVIRTEEK